MFIALNNIKNQFIRDCIIVLDETNETIRGVIFNLIELKI